MKIPSLTIHGENSTLTRFDSIEQFQAKWPPDNWSAMTSESLRFGVDWDRIPVKVLLVIEIHLNQIDEIKKKSYNDEMKND